MNAFKKIFKSRPEKDGIFFKRMQSILGFKPRVITHYEEAFTHRSLGLKKEDGNPLNYERLEFLGDAMLGAVIAAHLFGEAQGGNEGYLTKMRSKVVSRKHLNELGKELNLLRYIKASISKEHFGANIYGNLFESLVGAIYLDRGYLKAQTFILEKLIDNHVDLDEVLNNETDFKSRVIEYCQKNKWELAFVLTEHGEGERKIYKAILEIGGVKKGEGEAHSKKQAEQQAAEQFFNTIN